MQYKKEHKRELILDAAFELILEKGYSNTKIIDIANKIGIGKGTVYEYFESKDAIALELISTRAARDYTMICEEAKMLTTAKEQLTRYVQLQLELFSKFKMNITDFRNEFMRADSEISTKIMDAIHGIAFLQLGFIYNIIEKGIANGEFRQLSPHSATICFLGSINTYLGLAHYYDELNKTDVFKHFDFDENQDSFLDCIFEGLLA
jgi:AcrR family transcriptional regulator